MKFQKFLSQSPLFAMYRAQSIVMESLQARLAKEELHFLQGLILTSIFFEDREVRPLELARQFQLSRSNLSHALRGLEKLGLLKRSIHPTDARGYLFSLTASGKKKAQSLVKIIDEVESVLERRVSAKSGRDFLLTINTFIESYRGQYSLDTKATGKAH